ncbi:MAG: PilT/PilU family type 4a pilus ATPase [Candidatus Latescibacterota bacterium]|nr:MAG: PilT/PilU family type 4a pilus ATPase [Candidatus Latescibacterota bacterium]
MARIDAFLQLGREQGCSDIHLTVGLPPLLRMDGELVPVKYRELDARETESLVSEILEPHLREELQQRGSVDFSYRAEGLGRFRVNVYRQNRGLAAVCRVIPQAVPRLTDLGLPAVVASFTTLGSGLILVTGGTGTGKSTTLAAMIAEINETRNVNIITLEDPVEFQHESKKSLVLQREIGTHLDTFSAGLRSALRQDPDVILVGELRDPETIALAVEASETGHLVLGTLHTRGAHQTIHRIVDAFPTEAQSQIRHTLAENLKAVISQELVRTVDGRGRRVVLEILVVTTAVAQLIREGKTHQIPSAIATGRRVGMQALDQALLSLVRSGDIDPDEAYLRALDKAEFAQFITRPELQKMVETQGTRAQAVATEEGA